MLLYFSLAHIVEGRRVDWADYGIFAVLASYFLGTLMEAARTSLTSRRERRGGSG